MLTSPITKAILSIILITIVPALFFKMIKHYNNWRIKELGLKKDDNSVNGIYWMATAISLLVYEYGLYGFSNFLEFSSSLIGTGMIPLALSIVVHLFARKNFPKTLCYITLPVMIWHFFNLFY